jgi:hypothetical protein
MMTSVPSHVTPLRLAQRASLELVTGCPPAALADPDWLGTPVESARPGTRRYLTDLSLPVRERSPQLTFKKAAFVDVGEARATSDGCEMEISWQSSSLAPLFPVFAGRLKVRSTEIALEGFYAPPGGEFGAVLDRAFLNIAARGTARWFLERAAEALSSVAAQAPEPTEGSPRSESSTAPRPPVDPRPDMRSKAVPTSPPAARTTIRGRAVS